MAPVPAGVYIPEMEKPRAPSSPRPRRQAAIALAGSVAITLAMFLIPSPERTWWLLAPFRWLHIYVHEFGHGVAALLAAVVMKHRRGLGPWLARLTMSRRPSDIISIYRMSRYIEMGPGGSFRRGPGNLALTLIF